MYDRNTRKVRRARDRVRRNPATTPAAARLDLPDGDALDRSRERSVHRRFRRLELLVRERVVMHALLDSGALDLWFFS